MALAPDVSAQFRRPILDIWSGLDGFKVGFVGGATRETLAELPTLAEAGRAYRAAVWASDRLDAICRGRA